jgi:MinD-like ATPase involved in chromosome partitioning or flagellar assembly
VISLGTIIAVHSYKGGTGKTLLSVNLAVSLLKHGRRVCLLDLDFRAPSLSSILKIDKAEHWLNDYLNGTCNIDKVFIDISDRFDSKGKLLVGLANPATEAIREMSARDRKWEMRALGRLLSLKNSVLNAMEFDYLIFDTSPGLQYSSINAIVSADLVIVATTFDTSDIRGTNRMLRELYDLFEKRTEIVVNKILSDISSKSGREKLQREIRRTYEVPVLEMIPCLCDVSRAGGTIIFAHEKPQHKFSKIMDEMAAKIEKM